MVLGAMAFLIPGQAKAEPTQVTVRVISQDAKFVGDAMGGARVTLRDADSRRILATGVTKGGTGDTDKIMQTTGRSPLRATPEAAAFTATIDIDVPTRVSLEVQGPLGRPGSLIHSATERWIMPGRPIALGNGWTIELPGLAITPASKVNGQALAIQAKVELMCGCPITVGGMWDAAEYNVEASLWQRKRQITKVELTFLTAPGGFAANIPLPRRGRYRLVIFAQNARTGNSGYSEEILHVR